jgi:hypothetical protein
MPQADFGLGVLFMSLGFAAIVCALAWAYDKWKGWHPVNVVLEDDDVEA